MIDVENLDKPLLLQGDCLDLMGQVPDGAVDLILVDLPYGATSLKWDRPLPLEDYVLVDRFCFNEAEYFLYAYGLGVPHGDAVGFWQEYRQLGLWSHYKRIIKENGAVVLFGQEPFSSTLRQSNLADYKYDIYWEKERLTNINQVKRRVGKTVETISVFYKKQCTYHPQMQKYEGKPRSNKVKNGTLGGLVDENKKKVFEYKDTGFRYPTQVWKFQRDCLKSNLHPTQKPVALLEELIKTFSNEGDVVFDGCMGSGSTGVAALNTDRKFIGIEIQPDMFHIAQNRIEAAMPVLINEE